VHLCLNDGGDRRIEGWLHADAPTDAWRQWLTPIRLFSYEVQHVLDARRLSKHVAPKCDRILVYLASQLIQKAFDGEHVIVWTNTAPKAGRHGRRLDADIFHLKIWNVVRRVGSAIDGVAINAVLEGGRQPSRDDR